jgi:hypothetical protein
MCIFAYMYQSIHIFAFMNIHMCIYIYIYIYIYILNRLAKLSFKVDDFGKIKTYIDFWEDVLLESSYNIEPPEALIGPYGTHTFKVTLNKTGTYQNYSYFIYMR